MDHPDDKQQQQQQLQPWSDILPCTCPRHDDDDNAFFRSLPPGVRFNPTDEELIVHYLTRKVYNQPLPRNQIFALNLYHFNPQMLPRSEVGEKDWEGRESYYFTPRNRKYLNGGRPNRAAGDGYWKATGADKKVVNSRGEELGFKKSLVFYHGKPPTGEKTSWIMHEYRINGSLDNCDRTLNKMMLDNWVLCKVYLKVDTKNGKKKKDSDNTDDGSENDEEEEDGDDDDDDDPNDQKPGVGDRSNSALAPVPVPVPVDPMRIVSNENQNLPSMCGFMNQAATPFRHHQKPVVLRDRSNSPVFTPAPVPVPIDPIRMVSNQNENLSRVYGLMNQAAAPFQHHQKPLVGSRPNSPVFAPAPAHVPVDPIRLVPNHDHNHNQNQNLPPVYGFTNQAATPFQPPMCGFMNQAATKFEPNLWTGTVMGVAYPFYMNEETTLVYDGGINFNDANNATMEQYAQQIVTRRRGLLIDNNNNNNNSSFSSNNYNYLENEDLPQGVYIQPHTTSDDTIGTYGNDQKPQDNETPQDVCKDIR